MYCMQQFLLVWILLVVMCQSSQCLCECFGEKGVLQCCGSLDIQMVRASVCTNPQPCFYTSIIPLCVCVCVSICVCGTNIFSPSLHLTASSLQQHAVINDQLLIGRELRLIMNMHTYSQSTQLRGCSHSSMLIGYRSMVSLKQLIENCSQIMSTLQHIWRRRECFRCGLRRGSHF